MSNDRLGALRRALSWPIARRSLLTRLIVGSILNIINQGDALVRSGGAIDWWKLLLTYCVPFCVATFGAYSAFLSATSETAIRSLNGGAATATALGRSTTVELNVVDRP